MALLRAKLFSKQALAAFEVSENETGRDLVREAISTLDVYTEQYASEESIDLLRKLSTLANENDMTREGDEAWHHALTLYFAMGDRYVAFNRLERPKGANAERLIEEFSTELDAIDFNRVSESDEESETPNGESSSVEPSEESVADLGDSKEPALIGDEPESMPKASSETELQDALKLAEDAFGNGDLDSASMNLAQAIAKTSSDLAPNHELLIQAQLNLAKVLLARGHLEQARKLLQEVLASLAEHGHGESAIAITVRERLAEALKAQSDFVAAIEQDEVIYEYYEEHDEPESPRLQRAGRNFIASLLASGDLLKATGYEKEFQKRSSAPSGSDEQSKKKHLLRKAESAFEVGDYESAGDFFAQYIRDNARRAGPDDEGLIDARIGLARARDRSGEFSQASTELEDLIRDLMRTRSEDDPHVLRARKYLARAYRNAGRSTDSRAVNEEILASERRVLSPKNPQQHHTRRKLAADLRDEGRPIEALTHLRDSHDYFKKHLPANHPVTIATQAELVDLLEQVGEIDAALAILEPGISKEFATSIESTNVRDLIRTADQYQSECRLDDALQTREQIVASLRQVLAPEDPAIAEGLRDVAALLRVLQRVEEARVVEMEARLMQTPDLRDRLASAIEASHASGAQQSYPPTVRISEPNRRLDGGFDVIAEVNDPSGVLAVRVRQDGVSHPVSIQSGEWQVDPDGTRGVLSLILEFPPDELVSVVSIAAENQEHQLSGYTTVVLKLQGSRVPQ